jgi:hypothetical protein
MKTEPALAASGTVPCQARGPQTALLNAIGQVRYDESFERQQNWIPAAQLPASLKSSAAEGVSRLQTSAGPVFLTSRGHYPSDTVTFYDALGEKIGTGKSARVEAYDEPIYTDIRAA